MGPKLKQKKKKSIFPELCKYVSSKLRHICKIYAIFLKNQFGKNLRTLKRNQFCRNILFVEKYTFVGRKMYPKIFYVEKNDKYQVCRGAIDIKFEDIWSGVVGLVVLSFGSWFEAIGTSVETNFGTIF